MPKLISSFYNGDMLVTVNRINISDNLIKNVNGKFCSGYIVSCVENTFDATIIHGAESFRQRPNHKQVSRVVSKANQSKVKSESMDSVKSSLDLLQEMGYQPK